LSLSVSSCVQAVSRSIAEIIIDRDPAGWRLTKVKFDGNPAKPGLIIVEEEKPNLAPDPISSGSPVVEIIPPRRFDAILLGTAFGWISKDDLESPLNTFEIAELIRGL
jgi:hypothetical protein